MHKKLIITKFCVQICVDLEPSLRQMAKSLHSYWPCLQRSFLNITNRRTKKRPHLCVAVLNLFFNTYIAHCSAATPPIETTIIYGAATGDRMGALTAGAILTETIRKVQDRGPRKAIVIEGTFLLTTPLKLCNIGNFRLSSPHRTAVLKADGDAVSEAVRACNADGLRLEGFTVEGFSENGIFLSNSRGAEIAHLVVRGTRSKRWSMGAIHLTGHSTGAFIHDNLIDGADYAGIIVDTDPNSDVSRVRIEKNRTLRTCRLVADCGAIYIDDRKRTSTNITIAQNWIEDFGPLTVGGRGIYLDDWASNVRVLGNTIIGPGRFAIQIHGGHNNRLGSNIIVTDKIYQLILYEPVADSKAQALLNKAGIVDGREKMIGNLFKNNQIFQAKSSVQKWAIHRHSLIGVGALVDKGNKWCSGGVCKNVPY